MQKIDVALSAFPNNEGAVQPDISTVDADANAAEAEYLRKNIEAYLYDYMTGPLGGDVDLGHAGKVEMYKAAFSETALNLFDPSLLERADDYSKEYGHNPLLNELAGVLASLDHNAGVYYSDEDVEGLFSVAAS